MTKTYPPSGFIDEHRSWNGRPGQCYFAATVSLPEFLRVEFLMGYDGPFRLWIDGKPAFSDLAGTNPCHPDKSSVIRRLPRGKHEVVAGMDLNGGRAWGFFLGLARPSTKTERKSAPKIKP